MPRSLDSPKPHSAHVLLVQPHAETREMYAEFLRQNGMATVAVGDGNDALPLTATADVVVTGILVPGIDGIELISRVRNDTRTQHTPIIVLTACAFPADRERAEHAGCDVFLPLPCLPMNCSATCVNCCCDGCAAVQ